MPVWTAPGRVLIAWDGKLGPSWDYDEEDVDLALTTGKRYDHFEVYRSVSPVEFGSLLGVTKAEAWLDVNVNPHRRYYYSVVGYRTADGPGEVVGGTLVAETPRSRVVLATRGTVAPGKPDDVKVTKMSGGNRIAIKPGGVAKAPVLAYLVYADNGSQPDSVVWVDSWDTETGATHDYWTDRTTDVKGYVLRTIDEELNISEPSEVVTSPSGSLYAADFLREVIYAVVAGDTQEVIAGALDESGFADGDLAAARFYSPAGIAVDGDVLYVADAYNHAIRTVDLSAGTVATLSGAADDWAWHDGPLAEARFFYPRALAATDAGDLWVIDTNNYCIRYISVASSTVTTLAGAHAADGGAGGQYGCRDGTGSHAFIGIDSFAWQTPGAVVVAETSVPHGFSDHDVADVSSPEGYSILNEVHVIDATHFSYSAGTLPTVPAHAFLSYPLIDFSYGCCVCGDDLWFTQDEVVRKCTPGGTVTTVAGMLNLPGDDDGTGANALFRNVHGIALGPDGALYVADSGNETIRRVTTGGVVTTVLGTPGMTGTTDGDESVALLDFPLSLAWSGDDCYIAELDGTVRLWSGGQVSTYASGLSRPYGIAAS